MSRATVEQILIRVEAATPESPIAVFKARTGLDAVFASTIKSREAIRNGNKLVGIFHNKQDLVAVEHTLNQQLIGA